MVIENNIPPVTVNDSIRIAKGIAYTGFPIAGLLGAAMFAFFPMPYPIIIGLVSIGGVFVAFVAALTRERDEFHKINRARTQHEMSMKEVGYKANMRVWEAQQLAQIAPPVQAQLPPARPETFRLDGVEVRRDLPLTVLNRDGKDVRVDLIEAIFNLAFSIEGGAITNMKVALRESFPMMPFRDESLTLARRWLVEQGVVTDAGTWMVDETHAREALADARTMRLLPSPIQG